MRIPVVTSTLIEYENTYTIFTVGNIMIMPINDNHTEIRIIPLYTGYKVEQPFTFVNISKHIELDDIEAYAHAEQNNIVFKVYIGNDKIICEYTSNNKINVTYYSEDSNIKEMLMYIGEDNVLCVNLKNIDTFKYQYDDCIKCWINI